MKLEHHPAASEFPMMSDALIKELALDIEKNGLRMPITICDGMILDGRNRAMACESLGITLETVEFSGDPWAYSWSANGQRRDLVAEQRHLIWLSCMGHSEEWKELDRAAKEEANRARSDAMKGLPHAKKGETRKPDNVVYQDDTPHSKDTPEPSRQAHARAKGSGVGNVTAARAEGLASKRPDLAARVAAGTMKPTEAHRQAKKDEVRESAGSLPEGKYTVIYADPPWKYGDSRSMDCATGAEHHYPTMPLSDLKAMDIKALSNDDSVLFLWATCPLLEDALDLAKAWGFKYKAQFVWDKIKHNMGHYNSVRHELLLICTRGSCTPENVKLYDSVQSIERKEHSRKPEEFREIINTLYPSASKIELFRRGDAREGWHTWGNESC